MNLTKNKFLNIFIFILIFQNVMAIEEPEYKVIKELGDSFVLELDRSLDCGKYLRLGPFSSEQMEFSIYENKLLGERLWQKSIWL